MVYLQVAESGDSLLARVYARRGIPTSLRAELWASILNIRMLDTALHFDQVLVSMHLLSCTVSNHGY
jgi:hypothetical protein